jgi:ribA/ribD-fused uncharacterized protein
MNNSTRVTKTHLFFWNTIYSQWYTAPKLITEEGKTFTSAEQYMMYKKAQLFNDVEAAEEILATDNPRTIKAIGRRVKNFNATAWSDISYAVVVQGNFLKFTQNIELQHTLREQAHLQLVEASPEDKIWGIGLHASDDRVLDESQWQGQNLLGKAIMAVRERILNGIN